MAPIAGFVGGWYSGANPVSAAETLVNWFPSAVETPGGAVTAELLPTPGVRTFATASVGGARGLWAGDGRCFAVFGGTLFEIDIAGTATSRGAVATDGRPVTFATNGDAGNQLLITAGGSAYCYNLTTNALTLVLSGGVVQGGVSDGFGVVLFDSGVVRVSALFDLLTWDPTQFLQRSIQSDLWQALLVDPYGYLNLIGSKTGESWSNQAGAVLPFAPDRSGLLEEGIAAPFSLAQAGKHKVWLSTNANGGYAVMAAQGFQARRISHHALERTISGYAVVSDAFGQTYEQEGHAFYLLTFPTARATWVYDFMTQQWHQRGTMQGGVFGPWRPAFHAFAFGKHLAADMESAKVYELRDDVYTDVDSLPIVRERQFYAGGSENRPVWFHRLEVLAQAGVGLTTGAGSDTNPTLALAVSDDYGRTFGTERQAALGKIGEYGRRCEWWGLGMARGRVYRIRASAGVALRLSAAFQDVEVAA